MTSKSNIAKLTLAVLFTATLAACGGGDDDSNKEPPVPLSSECTPPTTLVRGMSQYQIATESGWRGIRTDDDTWNEPVEFHGRRVVRNRSMQRTTYSAPANVSNRIYYQWRNIYFTWNADGSQTIYGSDYADNWDSDSDPDYFQSTVYDPPLVTKRYASLRPGDWFDSAVTGTVLTAEKGVTTTKQILNTSLRTTYHGQETIGVPAGALTSCHFTEQAGSTQITNSWVQRGTGIHTRREERGVDRAGVPYVIDEQLTSTTGYR